MLLYTCIWNSIGKQHVDLSAEAFWQLVNEKSRIFDWLTGIEWRSVSLYHTCRLYLTSHLNRWPKFFLFFFYFWNFKWLWSDTMFVKSISIVCSNNFFLNSRRIYKYKSLGRVFKWNIHERYWISFSFTRSLHVHLPAFLLIMTCKC